MIMTHHLCARHEHTCIRACAHASTHTQPDSAWDTDREAEKREMNRGCKRWMGEGRWGKIKRDKSRDAEENKREMEKKRAICALPWPRAEVCVCVRVHLSV